MAPLEQIPLDQARDRVRDLLAVQAGIVELAVRQMMYEAERFAGDDQETARVIWVLMRDAATSMRSVLLLTASFDAAIRDCYGIARSIFETAVNVAYIATIGPPAALRAMRHATQKAYRDLLRTDPDGLKVPPRDPPPAADLIPGMPEALGEFTRANGTELTEWAGLGVQGKLAAICERYPGVRLGMSVSLGSIYRAASEVLHGTLYASSIFYEPRLDENGAPRSFEDRYVFDHLLTLFIAISGSVNGMLEVVGERYDLPEIASRVRDLLYAGADLMVSDRS
ncbi:MAG TPA: hypothetical protein P5256_01145 [Beijerinckiaceae bacterium]|nr:hypothetical protein [Methylobacteriaceae bacterium]HRY01701.1 hypothetical protein [Beijerinckiaceae bacterium]